MKKFRQLLEGLPHRKVVIAFGSFQPVTSSDEALISSVQKIAEGLKSDHVVFAVSDLQESVLAPDRSVYFLRRAFPKGNFKSASIDEAVGNLLSKYTDVVIVGSNTQDIKKIFEKAGCSSVSVVPVQTTSFQLLVKEAAAESNFGAFRSIAPKSLTDLDAKRLMNEVREGMGLEAIKEQVKFATSELREQYHRGDIFKLGDVVECDDHVYKIAKRGSNHLLLQCETGELLSKWIHEVTVSEKPFVLAEEYSDKEKIAKAIAEMLGFDDDHINSADDLVNKAIRYAKNLNLESSKLDAISKMIELAKDAGIAVTEEIVDTGFGADAGKVGIALEPRRNKDYLRKMKVKYYTEQSITMTGGTAMTSVPSSGAEGMRSGLNDKNVDNVVSGLGVSDWCCAYDPKEIQYIDVSGNAKASGLAGDTVSGVTIGEEIMIEAKEGREFFITVQSTPKQFNDRARKLAQHLIKTRFSDTKVTPKQHGMIAMKLVPGLRKFEKQYYRGEQQ